MPVRSGPRPKQANVPPFGFELNNDGCKNDTWCPAYQPGSIRSWPPLAAPAAPACPTTAARANVSTVAIRRTFMVTPPNRMCVPDRRKRVFARTYRRLCRCCAGQIRASVGQRVDEVVLERRRHDVNNLGRCHRRQRLDEDDVSRERQADHLRTDEDGPGLGPVVADRDGEGGEVAGDGLAD